MCSNGDVSDAARLAAASAAVAAVSAASLDDLTELYRLRNRVEAAITRAVADAWETGSTVDDAGLLPSSWLVRMCNRAPGEARATAALARRLHRFPYLAERYAAGAVSQEAARVVVRGLDRLRPADQESAEQILVEAAEQLPPPDVALLAGEIAERTGAGESAEQREIRRLGSRGLDLGTTLGGMVFVHGLLDPLAGERLIAALRALADTSAGVGDTRSPRQRRADALGEIAARALQEGWLPDHGGDRPQVMVTIPLADLVGEGLRPDVQLPLSRTPLSVTAVRQLACTAGLIPVVLGGAGQPLDIGRASSMWTVAIRRAARVRDRDRCTFPGCTAGPGRLELHHLGWWSRGGKTSLENSATLCTFHHWLVHHGSWTLRRDPATGQLVAAPHWGITITDQPGERGGASPPPEAYPADRQWPSNHPDYWIKGTGPAMQKPVPALRT